MHKNRSIGVFDSGIGGLTIAKELLSALPDESIIYFGDTQHLPYGDKSAQAIQEYSRKITDFLLAQNIKMIVIACHSASAVAYEMLKDYVGDRAIVVDMVNPVVQFLKNNYARKKVGIIGTKATIDSKVYSNQLAQLNSQIDLVELQTPLLVPIIEEGFAEHQLMDTALGESLSVPELQDIDALVLGCTHYPLIKKQLNTFYQNRVTIIDPAEVVTKHLSSILEKEQLISASEPSQKFYISDYTEHFAHSAKMFFGDDVVVEALEI